MTGVVLRLGDCREVLARCREHSVDSVVTDPPYGLSKEPNIAEVLRHWLAGNDYKHKGNGFMGKSWDSFVPGPIIWREVFRVLKPGGHLLCFAGSRTVDLMGISLRMAGFEIRDQIQWVYGSGFPKSLDVSKVLGKAESAQADEWQGWGTALKPAHEPIIVARKPLVGTVAANVLQWGVGALNIDGCRVPTEDNLNGGAYSENRKPSKSEWVTQGGTIHNFTGKEYTKPTGRFPANLIHDGSDEVLACFPDAKGQHGDLKGHNKPRPSSGRFGDMAPAHDHPKRVEVETSAARFFYCAKASKSDRGESNNHPTVKPIALMRYLVCLVTPPGGLVCDPFTGSGTTGVAARLEGFKFFGITDEQVHIDIAARRIREVV